MCKTEERTRANKNKTHLGQGESSVAEHADLICDVVPCDTVLLLALLQLLTQQQAHVPDAIKGWKMNEMRDLRRMVGFKYQRYRQYNKQGRKARKTATQTNDRTLPIGHALALFVPLGLEDRVTEHLGHNASTVDGRV